MDKINLVENSINLKEIVEEILKSSVIAIDTEFERRNTYFPILSLVQIYDGKEIYIIDCQKIKDISLLKEILFNPNILKVFHSARQDLEVFYNLFHKIVTPIFDSQVAASLTGFIKAAGYDSLCQEMFGVEISKLEQSGRWLKRPLSDAQKEYAALDVYHLLNIYKELNSRINQKDCRFLYDKIISDLCATSNYKPNYATAWKKVRTRDSSPGFVDKLQILAALREELAVKLNLPRRHILEDDDLIALCNNMPNKEANFQKLRLTGKYASDVRIIKPFIEIINGYIDGNNLM